MSMTPSLGTCFLSVTCCGPTTSQTRGSSVETTSRKSCAYSARFYRRSIYRSKSSADSSPCAAPSHPSPARVRSRAGGSRCRAARGALASPGPVPRAGLGCVLQASPHPVRRLVSPSTAREAEARGWSAPTQRHTASQQWSPGSVLGLHDSRALSRYSVLPPGTSGSDQPSTNNGSLNYSFVQN